MGTLHTLVGSRPARLRSRKRLQAFQQYTHTFSVVTSNSSLTMTKGAQTAYSATASAVGVFVNAIKQVFSVAATSTGSYAVTVAHKFATATAGSSLSKNIGRFSVPTTTTASVLKKAFAVSVAKSFTATSSATIKNKITTTLTNAATSTASVLKAITHVFATVVASSSAALAKDVGVIRNTTASVTKSIAALPVKAMDAVSVAAVTLTNTFTNLRTYTATAASTASVVKKIKEIRLAIATSSLSTIAYAFTVRRLAVATSAVAYPFRSILQAVTNTVSAILTELDVTQIYFVSVALTASVEKFLSKFVSPVLLGVSTSVITTQNSIGKIIAGLSVAVKSIGRKAVSTFTVSSPVVISLFKIFFDEEDAATSGVASIDSSPINTFLMATATNVTTFIKSLSGASAYTTVSSTVTSLKRGITTSLSKAASNVAKVFSTYVVTALAGIGDTPVIGRAISKTINGISTASPIIPKGLSLTITLITFSVAFVVRFSERHISLFVPSGLTLPTLINTPLLPQSTSSEGDTSLTNAVAVIKKLSSAAVTTLANGISYTIQTAAHSVLSLGRIIPTAITGFAAISSVVPSLVKAAVLPRVVVATVVATSTNLFNWSKKVTSAGVAVITAAHTHALALTSLVIVTLLKPALARIITLSSATVALLGNALTKLHTATSASNAIFFGRLVKDFKAVVAASVTVANTLAKVVEFATTPAPIARLKAAIGVVQTQIVTNTVSSLRIMVKDPDSFTAASSPLLLRVVAKTFTKISVGLTSIVAAFTYSLSSLANNVAKLAHGSLVVAVTTTAASSATLLKAFSNKALSAVVASSAKLAAQFVYVVMTSSSSLISYAKTVSVLKSVITSSVRNLSNALNKSLATSALGVATAGVNHGVQLLVTAAGSLVSLVPTNLSAFLGPFYRKALSRLRTVIGKLRMAQVTTFYPPIDATSEQESIMFDFGNLLPSGGYLTSVISVTVSVLNNATLDTAPASRLLGSAYIVNSASSPRGSGVQNATVLQKVGNMVAGVTYLIQVVAQSSDGQRLSLWAHLPCVNPE